MLIAPAALSGGGPPGIGVVKWVPPLNRLGPLLVRNISESGNDVLARSVVDQSILTEEVIAGYRAPLEVTGWERGLWEFTLSPRRTITEAQLATIRRPTLVITGDSDAIVSPADSQQIAEAIPGAAFVVLSDVGHLPQEEDPEVTIAAWDRFFADLSG
jgi:pimeloyl-ACP methyl ester carboxylesterase